MKLRTIVLAGAASVLVAGAAVAATGKLKTMHVDLPNGSVAQIEYVGDVAPRVTFVPAIEDAAAQDPFAEMDRMMAQMEQRHQALMQQAAQIQRQAMSAASNAGPGQVVVTGNMPAGSNYSYTVVSTTSGSSGSCTQTVEYRSDGTSKEPKITRASSGDCDAVKPSDEPVPASTPPQPQPEKPFDPRTI